MTKPTAAPESGGFQELVIVSSGLARSRAAFVEVGGYVQVCEGPTDPAIGSLWNLPKSAAASEVVLRNPASARGHVRIVEIDGVPARPIRSNGASWDTGGIFDLYMFVGDVDAVYESLRQRGWQAYNDVQQYSVGDLTLRESIVRDMDGTVFCLLQHLNAPAPNPELVAARFGAPFNVALPVAWEQFDDNVRFFREVLGWNQVVNGELVSKPPGDSPSGLPRNLAMNNRRKFAGFVREGTDRTGSIQVLAYEGVVGRDFSACAQPPNQGIAAARFHVADLDELTGGFAARGGRLAGGPVELTLAPYGRVRIAAVTSPSGARLEFFSPV
ncbi:MAG: hypothetical protein AMXMBFR37_10020 [Steroidobacteraceae bacterium]